MPTPTRPTPDPSTAATARPERAHGASQPDSRPCGFEPNSVLIDKGCCAATRHGFTREQLDGPQLPASVVAEAAYHALDIARILLGKLANGEGGHPGLPCRRTHWIGVTQIEEWARDLDYWQDVFQRHEETALREAICHSIHASPATATATEGTTR